MVVRLGVHSSDDRQAFVADHLPRSKQTSEIWPPPPHDNSESEVSAQVPSTAEGNNGNPGTARDKCVLHTHRRPEGGDSSRPSTIPSSALRRSKIQKVTESSRFSLRRFLLHARPLAHKVSPTISARSIPRTLCPRAVSSFITVSPDAPLPMMAILDFFFGALVRQSAQLQGIGEAMIYRGFSLRLSSCLACDGACRREV